MVASSHRPPARPSLMSVVLSQSVAALRRFGPFLLIAWLASAVVLTGLLAMGARTVRRICEERFRHRKPFGRVRPG